MAQLRFGILLLCLIVSGPRVSLAERTFSIVNKCSFTVWPGTLSNAGMPTLWQGGLSLAAGATYEFVAPAGWAGRVWGRTGCSFDSAGAGVCQTGDCGRGLYCNGAGGIPPATLTEFTLDGYDSKDFYDVSLVDGYNLPLSIQTSGGQNGTCGSPGCISDLNLSCPSDLQVLLNGAVVACKSACEAFQTDIYCCSGAYNSPSLCGPTDYSKIFKSACPTAYSYAYDDNTSTFTCQGTAGYTLTFCPGGTSNGVGSPPPAFVLSPPPPPGTVGIVPPPPINETIPPPPLLVVPSPPPNTVGTAPPPPLNQTTPPTPVLLTSPPPPSTVGGVPPPPSNLTTPLPPLLLPPPPPPPLNQSTPPPTGSG